MYQIRGVTELSPAYRASSKIETNLRPREFPRKSPPSSWKADSVVIVAALTTLVRYVDVSFMIYFGLNKLANTKQPNLMFAVIDDLILALSSLGLFYAVNFYNKRTALPYAVWGLASICIQIAASHGPEFLPKDDYDIEIRQKLYRGHDIVGISSDADVELSRLIMKTIVISSQVLFQLIVLVFVLDRKWPL